MFSRFFCAIMTYFSGALVAGSLVAYNSQKASETSWITLLLVIVSIALTVFFLPQSAFRSFVSKDSKVKKATKIREAAKKDVEEEKIRQAKEKAEIESKIRDEVKKEIRGSSPKLGFFSKGNKSKS